MITNDDPAKALEHRVDSRLLALVDRAEAGELDRDAAVAAFVRLVGPLEALRRQGLHVRSVAGDVATASVALADVPRAARAAAVVYLQSAGGLRPGEESPAALGDDPDRAEVPWPAR